MSPNPREVKAVAAHSNSKKNRSMEFPPGRHTIKEGRREIMIGEWNVCESLNVIILPLLTQWTDGG